MRKILLLLTLSTTGIIFAQTNYPNITIFSGGKNATDELSICSNAWASDMNCSAFSCEGEMVIISLANCDPEADDSTKKNTINQIGTEVTNIINLADCSNGKILCLQLGEEIFIQKIDRMVGKKKIKQVWKLNLQRFVDMYGQKLSEAFPKNKIYVVDWLW